MAAVQSGGENLFVNEGFSAEEIALEFEGKHKLAQFSSSQSNLSGGNFDAPMSGNEGGSQDCLSSSLQ